jgi:5-methylcytosine-specific restriction enzyme A
MPTQSNEDRTRKWGFLPADYMRALHSLMPLSPHYIRMLQFHYAQPARTTTPAEMAKAVGFKSYGAANLHYGKLARQVCNLVGWTPGEEGDFKIDVFVKFDDKVRGQLKWIMRKELAQAIKGLGLAGPRLELLPELMPGEMPENTRLSEGSTYRVAVTAYERNPEARRMCLAHYGTSCVVCGFDFKATYGAIAEDFIHVHHIRMLATIGKEYTVDPVKDLRPVCPNCHSVIHLKSPPYTVEELKAVVIKRGKLGS